MAHTFRASYSCGVELTLDIIGKKWVALILAQVKEGAHHYGELRTRIPGVSEKMLSARLADLVADGLLERTTAGRRVRYALSPRGESLRPVLDAMHSWGVQLAARESIALDSAKRTGD